MIICRGDTIEDDDGNIVAIARRNMENSWWEPSDFLFPAFGEKKPDKATIALVNREIASRKVEARKNPHNTDWVI